MATFHLTPFITSRKYNLGILHAGFKEAEEMFEDEAEDAKFMCRVWRLAMLFWAVVPAFLVSSFLGKQIRTPFEVLTSCLGIVGILLPMSWLLIWKGDVLGSAQDLAMLVLLLAAIPVHLRTLDLAKFSKHPGGLSGAWAWLANLVSLPSSWHGGGCYNGGSPKRE
jgi:hypothetical protein